jgi:hypothetical protein
LQRAWCIVALRTHAKWSAFFFLLTCAQDKGTLAPETPVVPIMEQPTSHAVTAAPASEPDSVRVLYRGRLPSLGTGSVTTWLQGVTPSHRAYLTHHLAEPDRFAVEMVELSAQTSALQVAGLPEAGSRGFHPMSGSFEESLAAFADLVDQTGPFITRARDYAGPHVAASHEHIAYELSPDLLMLADRDGTHSRRLGPNLAAAYYPVFSHDGEHIAYTGCTPRMPVPQGAFSRCRYSVFVGALENQIEAREVISPQPPVFSPDGTSVYAASRDNDHDIEPFDRGGCAYRVDVETGAATRLACSTSITQVEFRQADDGKTGIFFGHTHDHGLEVHALDLPSGAERRVVIDLPEMTGVEVGSDGVLVLGGAQDIVVVDLATGAQRDLHRPGPPSFVLLSNQWRDGHTVYALEHDTSSFRILEVDARPPG